MNFIRVMVVLVIHDDWRAASGWRTGNSNGDGRKFVNADEHDNERVDRRTALSRSGSGSQSTSAPDTILFFVEETVVKTIFLALPELEPEGFDSKTAPVIGERNRLIGMRSL